jgi:hypothetical protein
MTTRKTTNHEEGGSETVSGPPVRDWDAEWKRDKEVTRAGQELAEALGLISSASERLNRDKRTNKLDFEPVRKHLRRKGNKLRQVILESLPIYRDGI